MTTWNITDAAGKQHQVSADSYWYSSDGDIHFVRGENGINREIAFFTCPIAVTEAAQHLHDPQSGEDRGEIVSVTWKPGEGPEGHKTYLVVVKQ